MRMEPDLFHEVLARVGPRITKQDTFRRRALEPGLKLAITLRYLGTGNSYMSLQYGFRVAFNTISILVIEVCQAIIDEYIACPCLFICLYFILILQGPVLNQTVV